MFGSGNNHFRISISDLKQRRAFSLKCFLTQAAQLGANAVIGVDLDYETVGGSGSMLMVTANGTAVKIEDD